jgi:superfamily I DNA/RNA helicase
LAYEGIAPRKITVLSPVAIQKSCFDSLLASGKFGGEEISSSFFDPEFNKITFSTIHSFKGLENSVIVLTDVEDLTSIAARSLLYVGMSRARQRLYMLLPEKLRSAYNKLNEESLKRLLKH